MIKLQNVVTYLTFNSQHFTCSICSNGGLSWYIVNNLQFSKAVSFLIWTHYSTDGFFSIIFVFIFCYTFYSCVKENELVIVDMVHVTFCKITFPVKSNHLQVRFWCYNSSLIKLVLTVTKNKQLFIENFNICVTR